MANRYRGANDEMRDALARVAPGTPLRDGIDRVVRAKAGALLVLDDESEEPVVREHRGRLLAAASSRGVRVETVRTDAPSEMARYASLLATGSYAALYLSVGLGRTGPGPDQASART